jgi:3-oxoacyl-[acyl-carrier protein] reductase
VDLELSGHTALVTGASRGIGRAIALRLAGEGARVVVCARREDALRDLVCEIQAGGGAALAAPCDVTDHEAAARVLDQAANDSWRVDILVNNAGLAEPKRLLKTTDADWQAGLEINLLSAVRFTRAFVPAMVESAWGRVINVSSTTAKLADPYYAIYGAAKAALISFSKTVAVSFASDGVTCNCVLPGITRTELVQENIANAMAATGASAEEVMERTLRKAPIPVGRLGEPEEIAAAVAFLASARANWITGVSLPIDGGTIPVVG